MLLKRNRRRERYAVRDDVANLPLFDTMHHDFDPWCIFYGFGFDTPGQWGQKGQRLLESLFSHMISVNDTGFSKILYRLLRTLRESS